jgi:hypothetical protein
MTEMVCVGNGAVKLALPVVAGVALAKLETSVQAVAITVGDGAGVMVAVGEGAIVTVGAICAVVLPKRREWKMMTKSRMTPTTINSTPPMV